VRTRARREVTDVSVPPEIRQRILEEEKIRVEAQERFKEEIRLRQHTAALFTRVFLLVLCFATGLLASEYYRRSQSDLDITAPVVRKPTPQMNPEVLNEITRALKPPARADVCVRTTSTLRPQVKATIELVRETSAATARRIALANARAMGAVLQKHGLVVSAYVEIFSPRRWHGLALYDSDNLRVTWDACPGRCREQGTLQLKHCQH
jgi:hypothetical protein